MKNYCWFCLIVLVYGSSSCSPDTGPYFAVCDYSDLTTTASAEPTWVLLGSSTAAGAGATGEASSFSGLTKQWLQTSGVELVNLAKGGLVSYQVLPDECHVPESRMSFEPLANRNLSAVLAYQPSAIIVSLPSNDVAVSFSKNEILSNFEQMHRYSMAVDIPLILTGMQPRHLSVNKRDLLSEIDTELKKRYGACYLDIYSTLDDGTGNINSLYNADNVHLNDAGHAFLFERLQGLIASGDCLSM